MATPLAVLLGSLVKANFAGFLIHYEVVTVAKGIGLDCEQGHPMIAIVVDPNFVRGADALLNPQLNGGVGNRFFNPVATIRSLATS